MKTRSQQPRKHVEPKAVCKISKARHTRKNVVEVSQEDALALHSPEEVTEKRWELFRKRTPLLLVLESYVSEQNCCDEKVRLLLTTDAEISICFPESGKPERSSDSHDDTEVIAYCEATLAEWSHFLRSDDHRLSSQSLCLLSFLLSVTMTAPQNHSFTERHMLYYMKFLAPSSESTGSLEKEIETFLKRLGGVAVVREEMSTSLFSIAIEEEVLDLANSCYDRTTPVHTKDADVTRRLLLFVTLRQVLLSNPLFSPLRQTATPAHSLSCCLTS